jgi:hypothetical protein
VQKPSLHESSNVHFSNGSGTDGANTTGSGINGANTTGSGINGAHVIGCDIPRGFSVPHDYEARARVPTDARVLIDSLDRMTEILRVQGVATQGVVNPAMTS